MISFSDLFARQFDVPAGKSNRKLNRLLRLGGLLFAGHAVGLTVSHALVLRGGPNSASTIASAYAYICPVAVVVFFLQAAIKRFLSGTRLLMGTAIIGAVLTAAAPLLLGSDIKGGWFILVGSYVAWLITTLQFWLAADELLSPGESRKVLPPVVCSSMLGACAGGVLTWILSWIVAPHPVKALWMWTVLLLLLARECRLIARSHSPDSIPASDHEPDPKDKGQPLRHRFSERTLFLAAVWLFTLFGWAALTQLDFSFFYALSEAQPASAASLMGLLGLVHAGAALLGLVLRLYLSNPLLAYLGVGNTLLIMPAMAFLFMIIFTLLPTVAVGAGGRIIRVALFSPLHLLALSSLYHPIPERHRSRSRQFADGLAAPLGIGLCGVLLGSHNIMSARLLSLLPLLWGGSVLVTKRLYVKSLIRNLEDSNYYVRFAAIEGLGRSRDKRAVESLIRALNDRNVSIRLNAAVALGQLGVPEALDPLSRTLSDSDELVRAEAARSLGKLGLPQAAEPLINVFRRENADRVKATIIKALGTLGDMSVVGLLIDHLKHQDSRVRANAIEALADVGGTDAGDQLLPLLDDPNNRVRANAVVALWKLSHKRGILQGTECLHRMLDSEIPLMRASAAAAMGMIGDESFFSLLIRCLQDNDPQVRRNAARALEAMPSYPKLRPLLDALADDDTAVAQSAIRTLSSCPNAVEPLISSLSSANPKVRANAALALARGKHKEALDSLALLLKDFNPEVRLRAVEGISQLEDHRILNWILPLTTDDDDAVRATAVAALPRTLSTTSSNMLNVPHTLTECLDDASWRVRANALDALDTMEHPELPSLAARILEHEKNSRVRAIAARILYKANDPRGKECLTLMTESTDKWARVNAIYAMRDIADPRLIQLLMKALSDPDPDVRRNALATLETVGGEVVESLLRVVKESGSIELPTEDADTTGALAAPGVQAIEGAREVRRVTFMSLKDLGTIPENDILEKMIRDEIARARSSLYLLKSLKSLGDSSAVPPLLELLDERMQNSRNLALEAFGYLTGKPDDAAAITRSLSGTGEISHEEIVEILSSFGEKELLKQLLGYLREEWGSDGSFPRAGGLETLASLLDQEEQPVLRSLAASAIVEIGMSKLLDPLEKALNDPAEEVREEARRGLEKLDATLQRLSGASPGHTEPCSAPAPTHT